MEIRKEKLLFIAYDADNKAVWNAIKLHVEFVKELERETLFIVDEKYIEIIKSDYPSATIYSYSSLADLSIKLVKIDADYIFSPVMFTTLLASPARLFSDKKITYWVQGAVPEESYLRHKSKLRYKLLSTIEYLALRVSNRNIFVSTQMRVHLEKKIKRKLNNSVIIPCISEFSYDGSPKERDSFVYIGGMSAWQRVDIMLEMFNEILNFKPNAKLYIATLEQEVAKDKVKKYLDKKYIKHIEVLSIDDRSKIPHFLSTKEYGFLIREDIIVNNVSSPIKLAEYLSCGVNLIISDAITSYASIIEDASAGIKVSSIDNSIEELQTFQPNTTNALEVYKKYFSKEAHTESYKRVLSKKEK